jgi:hypothetical protein
MSIYPTTLKSKPLLFTVKNLLAELLETQRMIWQDCQCRLDYRGSCGAFDIKKLVLNKLKNLENQELCNIKYLDSIHFMSEGRSEDFQKHFAGHTFNPARYLKLFEIIPGPQTSSEVLIS